MEDNAQDEVIQSRDGNQSSFSVVAGALASNLLFYTLYTKRNQWEPVSGVGYDCDHIE